jgi:hypothetical protein
MLTLAVTGIGLCLLSAVSTPGPVSGQDPVPPTPPAIAITGAASGIPGHPGDHVTLWGFHTAGQQAAQLAQKYTKAEKDDERREIRKKLTDLLNQQFDTHLEQKKKELEELEKQIENLRKVLQKRQDAKDKIVERRFEQLVQEADGMGWGTPGVPHSGFWFDGNNAFVKPDTKEKSKR